MRDPRGRRVRKLIRVLRVNSKREDKVIKMQKIEVVGGKVLIKLNKNDYEILYNYLINKYIINFYNMKM